MSVSVPLLPVMSQQLLSTVCGQTLLLLALSLTLVTSLDYHRTSDLINNFKVSVKVHDPPESFPTVPKLVSYINSTDNSTTYCLTIPENGDFNVPLINNSQIEGLSNITQQVFNKLEHQESAIKSLEKFLKNAFKVCEEKTENGVLQTESKIATLSNFTQLIMKQLERLQSSVESQEESSKKALQTSEEIVVNAVLQTESKILALTNATQHIMKHLEHLQSSVEAQGKAAENFFKLSDQKKKSFNLITEKELSWFEAFADCKRQGMRLATIESEEEQEEVVNLVKFQVTKTGKQLSFWLSGSNLGRQGDYVWMSTGQPLGYTAWYPGEPDQHTHNGEVEHCMSMKTYFGYKWSDHICSDRYNYICENRN